MDPAWLRIEKLIRVQGDLAILHVEPRLVPGAGRGLFATKDLKAIETVISIPGKFLLNAKTLGDMYPGQILPRSAPADVEPTRLTSIQLLSLHLYRVKRGYSDTTFDAYIDTLPVSFSDHPLAMIQDPKLRQRAIDLMPNSVADLLLGVERRLKEDWTITLSVLDDFPNLEPPGDRDQGPASFADYIWAWLNVNTRCLYHDLGFPNSGDNLTMCPLLDFANHTSVASLSITQNEYALGDGMAFSTSGALKRGEQVFLRYGGHSNAFLFAEYGFVLPIERQEAHILNGEINIDADVEELLQASTKSDTKTELLKARGYWRDWTLHVEDGSARPSYRLIPALRLIHISLLSPPPQGKSRSELRLWEDSINGVVETISAGNELMVRESVNALCQRIIQRSEAKLSYALAQVDYAHSKPKEWRQLLNAVAQLWGEEQLVAEKVQEAVSNGLDF